MEKSPFMVRGYLGARIGLFAGIFIWAIYSIFANNGLKPYDYYSVEKIRKPLEEKMEFIVVDDQHIYDIIKYQIKINDIAGAKESIDGISDNYIKTDIIVRFCEIDSIDDRLYLNRLYTFIQSIQIPNEAQGIDDFDLTKFLLEKANLEIKIGKFSAARNTLRTAAKLEIDKLNWEPDIISDSLDTNSCDDLVIFDESAIDNSTAESVRDAQIYGQGENPKSATFMEAEKALPEPKAYDEEYIDQMIKRRSQREKVLLFPIITLILGIFGFIISATFKPIFEVIGKFLIGPYVAELLKIDKIRQAFEAANSQKMEQDLKEKIKLELKKHSPTQK